MAISRVSSQLWEKQPTFVCSEAWSSGRALGFSLNPEPKCSEFELRYGSQKKWYRIPCFALKCLYMSLKYLWDSLGIHIVNSALTLTHSLSLQRGKLFLPRGRNSHRWARLKMAAERNFWSVPCLNSWTDSSRSLSGWWLSHPPIIWKSSHVEAQLPGHNKHQSSKPPASYIQIYFLFHLLSYMLKTFLGRTYERIMQEDWKLIQQLIGCWLTSLLIHEIFIKELLRDRLKIDLWNLQLG